MDIAMRLTTHEELLALLDDLYDAGADRTSAAAAEYWDALFQREGHPLRSDLPDANLVAWHSERLLGGAVGRTALDVGCGLGRNSRWLAAQGFVVTGIDIAPRALEEAELRSREHSVIYARRDFVRDVVGASITPFDVVYDSGCFHHLAPHRRISYMQALAASLAPSGLFGVCTFAAGRVGTTASDRDLLIQRSLEGGIGYTTDDLREMFSWLELIDCRPMPTGEGLTAQVFTQDFLHVALFRRSAD